MSCSEKYSNFNKKPRSTETSTYIWSEVKNNPNLYCWIPISKKKANLESINLDEVNIQDIPLSEKYNEYLNEASEKADDKLESVYIKNLNNETDLYSSDDPRKYPIVKQFIIDKGLKLYGGAAIDKYLPKDNKIYSSNSIPDYDAYSPTPWKHAIELGHILYKSGYKYTEIRSGIHKGTYKVSANFWDVADISYMSQELFDKLKTYKINNINIVSPARLNQHIYRELSQPSGDPRRWAKISSRQKLLNKWVNPIKPNLRCSQDIFLGGKKQIEESLLKLLQTTSEFINNKKLILTGSQAYNIYMAISGARRRVQITYYEVLSEHADKDAQELLTLLLPQNKDIHVKTYMVLQEEINNLKYTVYTEDDKPICIFYQLSSCTPFIHVSNRYIVAIDYLKYILYTTVVYGYKGEDNIAKCKIKYLEKAQQLFYNKKNVSEFDNTPFKRYVTTCKGPSKNIVKHVKLQREIERIEHKEKRKIKSNKCKDMKQNNCIYPCYWDDEKQICENVPDGTIRIH
jgi:hypothetical protein